MVILRRFFMVQKLQDFMCKYIKDQTEPFKGYLLAALNNKDHYLCLLSESLGTPVSSTEINQCELLTNAGLFREEIKLTRDGRNQYKLFYLTDKGKEIAEQVKEEGYTGEIPQNAQIA